MVQPASWIGAVPVFLIETHVLQVQARDRQRIYRRGCRRGREGGRCRGSGHGCCRRQSQRWCDDWLADPVEADHHVGEVDATVAVEVEPDHRFVRGYPARLVQERHNVGDVDPVVDD